MPLPEELQECIPYLGVLAPVQRDVSYVGQTIGFEFDLLDNDAELAIIADARAEMGATQDEAERDQRELYWRLARSIRRIRRGDDWLVVGEEWDLGQRRRWVGRWPPTLTPLVAAAYADALASLTLAWGALHADPLPGAPDGLPSGDGSGAGTFTEPYLPAKPPMSPSTRRRTKPTIAPGTTT